MSFTPYATAIAGSVLTAAWLNTYVRDNGNFIKAVLDTAPVSYNPTLQNVVNSTARTAVIAFTVGASEMADGDVIEIICSALVKNNFGSPAVLLEAFWGSTGVALSSATNWTANAAEVKQLLQFRLQRVGNDLWVRGQEATAHPDLQLPTLDLTPGYSNVVTMTPTFTSSQSVEVRLTFSAANAQLYFKPQKARVMKIRAA
ncbi:MAG TPA: hypothetical protein VIX73_37640 [Kofleriaceae bacterium]|jgi:hypothetical protein